MNEGAKPWIKMTPQAMGKMALSTVLMAIGMFYLTTGRKEASLSRMITGAIFTLASVLIFVL